MVTVAFEPVFNKDAVELLPPLESPLSDLEEPPVLSRSAGDLPPGLSFIVIGLLGVL